MKIALVIERLDPLRGGRETYTASIAQELARRGHEITVMCQSASWNTEGVFVVPFDDIGMSRLAKMRNFVAGVQEAISSGVYDVVHAMLPIPGVNVYHPHGGTIPGAMAASLRRRSRWSRPLTKFIKSFNRCRNESARLEKQIVEDDKALCICVSQLIADQFQEFYGATDRVRVVFNGVSTPPAMGGQRKEDRQRVRQEIGAAEGDPVFLTVCTNFPLKGVGESIEAFARWIKTEKPQGNPRYVVVGRQKVQEYEKLAERWGVGGQVVFVPPTRDVFQWYAAADAFVLLTWYDPCSLTVLEAGRWGLPSITTRYNGATHAFKQGGCIVTESPCDIDAAVAGFAELADPVKRQYHSDACKALDRQLSMARHMDDLLTAYHEAARLK